MKTARRKHISKTKRSAGHPIMAYGRIKNIIENARSNIMRFVNAEMVVTYWQIGKEIVEEEQRGESRAGYGEAILKKLSDKLTADFGKGFDESNLRNIRYFYLSYPKRDAVRHELSWTHYRILMRIEKPEARSFYEIECIKNNWSARELERQKGKYLFREYHISGNSFLGYLTVFVYELGFLTYFGIPYEFIQPTFTGACLVTAIPGTRYLILKAGRNPCLFCSPP